MLLIGLLLLGTEKMFRLLKNKVVVFSVCILLCFRFPTITSIFFC